MRSLIAALSLVAGCAVIDPEAARLAAADRMLAEAIQAARAPAGEQKAALSRAQQAFVAEGSPANRLRLAAMVALVPPPLRDDARALELLEPLVDASAPGPGRLAVVLQQHVLERQRLAREVERAGRDAERTTRERQQADRERDKREEALKAQLEALRGIERGILDREEKLRRKK
jgi:hypothetical protein